MNQEADSVTHPFSFPSEFVAHLKQCIGLAHHQLQLFDPDFSTWGIDRSDLAADLRHFLVANPENRLQIAYHRDTYLERECLRFMPLLVDFSHAIECRITPRNLKQLTDSFCIADDRHIVRRFHCDHFRGEAAFDFPEATQISAKRFADIWTESERGLQSTYTGL